MTAIGKGVILHSGADDGVSQPTGNSGSRLAQGVIGIRNMGGNNATGFKDSFAVCEFKAPSGAYGRILFTQNVGNTVRVQAKICGMTPNAQNGFHVHEFGDLTGTDKTTNTGGHWNPTGANHAFPPSTTRHYGDMGNLNSDASGVGNYDETLDLLTLSGDYSILGRAVVIHEGKDDGTGSTGNSGNKLGACTIGTVDTLPSLPTCPSPIAYGSSLILGTAGNTGISGKLYLSYFSTNQQTLITGTITGLPANSIHGFHIHELGDISKDDGTATGGHWNPFGGIHGPLTLVNSHAGDLGNITTDATGKATLNIISTKVDLRGNVSAIGRSFVIHSLPDDGVSQPTGNSGSRIAQGVIGVQSAPNNNATSIQNSYAVCEFKGVSSTYYGRIIFTQNQDNTVRVQAEVCGLNPDSSHGFHVHEFGDLTGTDRTSNTGGHWNPTGENHAYPSSNTRHYGDMGNISTNSYGIGKYDSKLNLLTLNGLNSIVGRAVVIHSGADDGTGSTGNAGTKLGSCVIGTITTVPTLLTCPESDKRAVALIEGTTSNPNIRGIVDLSYFEKSNITLVSGTITGLPANSKLAFHIHQFGDLSQKDGTATGGHWNPYGGVHGFLSSSNSHAGDLVRNSNN
jgi:superoxide dismutase, Cu-Zn family